MVFLSERFCPGWRLSVPSSVRIHPLQQKAKTSLSILGFVCMKFFLKCDVTCTWTLPLLQTVTPSRTPSLLERDVLYGRPNGSHVGPLLYQILLKGVCVKSLCFQEVSMKLQYLAIIKLLTYLGNKYFCTQVVIVISKLIKCDLKAK